MQPHPTNTYQSLGSTQPQTYPSYSCPTRFLISSVSLSSLIMVLSSIKNISNKQGKKETRRIGKGTIEKNNNKEERVLETYYN